MSGNQPRVQPNQQPTMPAVRQESPLALPGGRAFMPSIEQWNQIKEMGKAAFTSGMLPSGIKTPEAAAIIGLKAYELGIPLMEGFAHIHVINGKPTISREMMQTLVTQNIPGAMIEILESTDKICKAQGTRPKHKPMVLSFSIEDAKRAGLLAKPGPWQQYPAAMLLNRAVSALCRAYFPDGLRGCSYTPEELEPAIETTGRRIQHDNPQPDPPSEPEKAQPPGTPDIDTLHESPAGPQISKRFAEMSAVLDPTKWPNGTVLKYCEQQFQVSKFSELSDNKWKLLLAVVKNSNAHAALGEFAMQGDARV